MGIFGFVRKLTGTTADVTLTVGPARRGDKFTVKVDVKVGPDPISAKRVYVTLRCNELVDIPKYNLPAETAKPGTPALPPKSIAIKANESLFEQEFAITSGQELAANSEHRFDGEIELPAHLPPTYIGRHTNIRWYALAGLDTRMTDPSTEWQELPVT